MVYAKYQCFMELTLSYFKKRNLQPNIGLISMLQPDYTLYIAVCMGGA